MSNALKKGREANPLRKTTGFRMDRREQLRNVLFGLLTVLAINYWDLWAAIGVVVVITIIALRWKPHL